MSKKQERLKKELEAQRIRAAASNYLASTGAGPSQRELAEQQKARRQLTNAVSAAVNKHVQKLMPTVITPIQSEYDKDNTLKALALRKAKEKYTEQQRHDQIDAYSYTPSTNTRKIERGSEKNGLPEGWSEVYDRTSGEKYYWNELTNVTSWEHPAKPKDISSTKKEENALPDGWEPVEDPSTGTTYYWNKHSNETTWTRPEMAAVSFDDALAAKSKLDAILAGFSSKDNSVSSPSKKKKRKLEDQEGKNDLK